MLENPILIMSLLILIEGAVFWLSGQEVCGKFFKYLPSMFWIYFLPMLANTAGLIPSQSPIYGDIVKWCLPASLVLLLLGVNLGHILKLGRPVLAIMFAGILGIMTGGPCVLMIYKNWLPENAWMGIGSLSASWIGGSANMIAVKEAIGTPDSIFLSVVVVDTIVPYLWMGVLIAVSAYQNRFDQWNTARGDLLAVIFNNTKVSDNCAETSVTSSNIGICLMTAAILGIILGWFAVDSKHFTTNAFMIMLILTASSAVLFGLIDKNAKQAFFSRAMIIFIAGSGAFLCVILASRMPQIKNFVNTAAWAVIIATFLGVVLSFTKVRRLEDYGSSKIGFGLLYLVLASIGAKSNITQIAEAPAFLFAGVTWILIHALFLLLAVKILRAPMSLAAAASQAAVGGPASAPVVAGIYHPKLAPVGLLLAVLGNILGTGLGIMCSHICRYVSSL